jgi:ABC-type multidrug transport system fused ATPase/permease subunit
MRERVIKISVGLFGLEYELLEYVREEEKNIFFKLSFLFLVLASICIASSIVLFFLICPILWVAMLVGALLALILLSIIRFSILTIQRSLFEEHIPEIPIETIQPLNTKDKLHRFLNKFKFPGIESIMRIIVNGIMGFLIIFPIVSLLHFKGLESLNQQKRDQVFNEFISSKTNTFTSENNRFNDKIKQLEKNLFSLASIESQCGVYAVKNRELNKLKTEQTQYKVWFTSNLEMESQRLINNLSTKYFIIYTFSKAISNPDFIFVTLAIFGLLFYLHYLQHSIKSNETYQYARLAKEKYVSIVMKDYHQTKLKIEKTLSNKFPNHKIDLDKISRWKNPPFNTEEKIIFPTRNSILKSELLLALTTK